MISNRIFDGYFNWMYDMVCGGLDKSYRSLLSYLYTVQFTSPIPMDMNRSEDGKNLRYRYGYEADISSSQIAETFNGIPCSVLEMMVALSIRCEEAIMSDTNYGDRTAQWFWNMIETLGLSDQDDDHFDPLKVGHIMYIFLNRTYAKDGTGGLFKIHDPGKDMRQTEIWYQMCFYLDEVLGV